MPILQGATPEWTKSSFSIGNGECVEVRSPIASLLAVQDSKMPSGPTLAFQADPWNTFVTQVSQGALDHG
ncbi:protein of unknown function DUF397 [Actinobacteria bacterium OK074]|nr:protein of unknown function DUF397 [Actinobacteria bacterium OK074]